MICLQHHAYIHAPPPQPDERGNAIQWLRLAPPTAMPAPGIDDILQQAKHDVGAIDKQLRKAGPGWQRVSPTPPNPEAAD